jgi:hypothetical protein
VSDRTYRLIVEGELSDHLASGVPGMTLTRIDGNTELTGLVRDQAELQGLLSRVADFGLTLLEARAVDDRSRRHARGSPAKTNRR